MSEQHVHARYALVDGHPTIEESTWQLTEGEAGGGCQTPFHVEPSIPNSWVLLTASNVLVPFDMIGRGCLFELPLRPEVVLTDEAGYWKAVDKMTAANEKAAKKAEKEALKAAQTKWDERAARYRRVGFTDDEVLDEIGPRPT